MSRDFLTERQSKTLGSHFCDLSPNCGGEPYNVLFNIHQKKSLPDTQSILLHTYKAFSRKRINAIIKCHIPENLQATVAWRQTI